jgi:hypothetical protein
VSQKIVFSLPPKKVKTGQNTFQKPATFSISNSECGKLLANLFMRLFLFVNFAYRRGNLWPNDCGG